ncbi:MAG: hypothetical protein ACI9FN_003373, partial [Saprospiraceae bacterium]
SLFLYFIVSHTMIQQVEISPSSLRSGIRLAAGISNFNYLFGQLTLWRDSQNSVSLITETR